MRLNPTYSALARIQEYIFSSFFQIFAEIGKKKMEFVQHYEDICMLLLYIQPLIPLHLITCSVFSKISTIKHKNSTASEKFEIFKRIWWKKCSYSYVFLASRIKCDPAYSANFMKSLQTHYNKILLYYLIKLKKSMKFDLQHN